jgi:hypothetical protein
MLTDGVASAKQQGKAGEDVRVADVSEVLLRSVRRAPAEATSATGPTGEVEATETDSAG